MIFEKAGSLKMERKKLQLPNNKERKDIISPLAFFRHLRWIDARTPLLSVIEPYRRRIFMDSLYSFNADGTPVYSLVLSGRAKKNWKSADLIFAALYKFLVWPSPQGNDCFLLANDEGQAADDLKLAKKLIAANALLDAEVEVKNKVIERRDGKGELAILPARDVTGSHGKTYLFVGFDEIHGYRNWDLFEALAPDPTRLDALTWITSYASIYNTVGAPLFDLVQQGRKGEDPRMYFTWYAGDCSTDPAYQDESLTPEERANPSQASWNNPSYLPQQKRRLPTHKYRRLHLNLPGMPEGTYLDAERVLTCIPTKRRHLKPQEGTEYQAFVDMSGGSSDDACIAIAHYDEQNKRGVLDRVETQAGRPPFNPRDAVSKFARLCDEYGISKVVGDRYAGETFRRDFEGHGISYELSSLTASQLYEALEPKINAAEVELLDHNKLQEQLLGLVYRGSKIDHLPGEHDDLANAAAGALWLVTRQESEPQIYFLGDDDERIPPWATPFYQ